MDWKVTQHLSMFVEREIKERLSSATNTSVQRRHSPQLEHLPDQGFYFGISYSNMCKNRYTTLLEYEGKKHVAPGER